MSPERRKKTDCGITAATAWWWLPEPDFLSPLVQALAPRSVRGREASATLGKPLVREFLFYRSPAVFGRRWAVACVLRGSLAYRGSMHCIAAMHWVSPKNKSSATISVYSIIPHSMQEKTVSRRGKLGRNDSHCGNDAGGVICGRSPFSASRNASKFCLVCSSR